MNPELEYVIRLAAAGLLGGAIGIEREFRAKEAGIRTHFLVSLGSALMMIVSMHGFGDMLGEDTEIVYRLDPGRMAAQVVSGIGFIGAGTIMMHKQSIRGLTTAAGLWAACGIGLAIGGGLYVLGTAATLMTIIGLELLRIVAAGIRKKVIHLELRVTDEKLLPKLPETLEKAGFHVLDSSVDQSKKDPSVLKVSFSVTEKFNREENDLFRVLEEFGDSAKIDKVE